MALTTEELDFTARAMLCDSVAAAEGKLYIQGAGWNQLNSPTYPLRIPRIGLAATISVPYTRTNQNHVSTIRFENGDGDALPLGHQPVDPADPTNLKPVYRAEAPFNIGRPPQLLGGESQTMPFAMNLDGLILDTPGTYSFVIEIDGKEVERATFRALSVTAPMATFG